MSVPVTLNSPPDSLPIAWNSFAHTDFVLKPGATTPTQLPFVEPPKVGVALPFGTLQIEKEKTGPLADRATGPFAAGYDCTVTPVGGSPESVANPDVGTRDPRSGDDSAARSGTALSRVPLDPLGRITT